MGNEISTSDKNSLFELEATLLDGTNVNLGKYLEGKKAIVVVNTASFCGCTVRDFEGFADLYEKYHSQGLEILGFPSNDYWQDFMGAEKIKSTATKHRAEFPIFEKIHVNGVKAHPVYNFLKSRFPGKIEWNFVKFLIDENGQPVKRFHYNTPARKLEGDIVALLKSEKVEPSAENQDPPTQEEIDEENKKAQEEAKEATKHQ